MKPGANNVIDIVPRLAQQQAEREAAKKAGEAATTAPSTPVAPGDGRPAAVASTPPVMPRAADPGVDGKPSPQPAKAAFVEYVAAQKLAKKPWLASQGNWRATCAATLRVAGRVALPLLAGTAVASAASLAAALTVTPWLLRLGCLLLQAGPSSPYALTRLVAGALARFGPQAPYALFAGAVTALGGFNAAKADPKSREASVWTALAQVGMGLVAAPFWQAAVAGKMATGLPALGFVAASLLGLQATLTHCRGANGLGPLSILTAGALLSAAAPVAAGVALGLGATHCLLAGLTTLSLASLTVTSYLWLIYRGNTDDRSTAFALSTEVKNFDRTKKLNLPGERAPTVFVDDPDLRQAASALLANHRAGHSCESLFLLRGPPGTGKTVTAQAIANLGGWRMFRAPTTALYDSPSPQSVLVQWFDEIRAIARASAQPVVVLMDEAELLFRDRDSAHEDVSAQARKPLSLTAAFNHELGGAMAQKNRNVIVVVSTNHPERLDPAIYDRFNGDDGTVAEFLPPTPAQLVKVFAGAFAPQHPRYMGLRKVAAFVPSAKLQADLEEALQRRPEVGRGMEAAAQEALVAANAWFGPRWRRITQGQFDVFVDQRLRKTLALGEQGG